VAAVITASTGKAVIKPAALQILAKGLADIGLGGVVVALAVELTGTGQLKLGVWAAEDFQIVHKAVDWNPRFGF
jgi:hypothetical protein